MKRFSSHKTALMVFMLVNAFLWFYLTFNIAIIISGSFNVKWMELLSFYSLGTIIGGVIGLFLLKIRYKILILWTFLGVITPLLPFFSFISTLLHFQLLCLVWGFSFGLGLPLCLGYFAETTSIENRGHFGGIVFLFSFFGAILIVSLFYSFELPTLYLFLSFWRLTGFIPLMLYKNKKHELEEVSGKRIISIIQGKVFCLYLIPWLMFNIVDGLEGLLLGEFVKVSFPEYYSLLQLLHLLFLGVFAFFGGFMCDLIGRKPITILGFVIMGVAYAVISIIPMSLSAWFLSYICYGCSWGLLDIVFIMLIWGDLAPKGLEEMYYFIGTLPFFLTVIVQMFFASYMKLLSEANAFSLAALFLFLAVIPLLYAPETLPEKTIMERELRGYVEKAKKLKEKLASEKIHVFPHHVNN
jgi:hypothetical protein